jgi:DNA polymerase III alpha subunit
MEVLPIFKSHYSLKGRSILTFEKKSEIKENSPVSIFDIAAKHNLNKITIIDDEPIGLMECFQNAPKDLQFIFGTNFITCDRPNEQDEESILRESKVSILFKNDKGYEDWIKIWNIYATKKEHFYYHTRIDWKDIVDNWTDNLIMIIPPFDNYIHANLLKNGKVIPCFGGIKPIYTIFDCCLPWIDVLNNKVKSVASSEKCELLNVNPIYYYKKSDFDAWQALKCIEEGTKYDKPNLNWCVSDEFSFENFLTK